MRNKLIYRWFKGALITLGHLLAMIGYFLTFWPTASLFLFSAGLMGVDSLQLLFYSHKFSLERAVFPPAGWKYSWFEGTAYVHDIPWLNFYLIQPLARWFGVFAATKIYFVGAIFVFLFFSYLLFYRLSKNIFLSLALTVALSRSYAIYTQLFSAGVGLSSIGQLVLPASLYFLTGYLEGKRKHLGWAIIFLAFGFYTHDLLTILFSFIPCLVFLPFSFYSKNKSLSRLKIKQSLALSIGVLLISLPAYFDHLLNFLAGYSVRSNLLRTPQGSPVKFAYLINSTNLAFFIFFLMVLILSPLLGLRKKLGRLLPLFLILVYILVFQLSSDLVINPLISVVFPHRFHWVLPLVLGAIIAIFLRRESGKLKLLRSVLVALLSLGIIMISFTKPSSIINPGFKTTLESLKFPFGIENLFADAELIYRKRLQQVTGVPLEMIDGEDINHRLYLLDPGSRQIWNLIYKMPQTHGYYHHYTPRSIDWFSWLYTTFSYENFEEGGIPADIAQRQALFLADWYAIRYLITSATGEAAVAPHFYEDNVYVKSKSAEKGPALIELSSSYVSSIAKAADEPVVGFIGDDEAYDYFIRNLGILNLNSNYLIPIRAANFVEDLTQEQLANFDGLVLYNYRKKGSSQEYQRSWQRLENFIKQGGFIWVETGAECPEKWGEPIPAPFPVLQLKAGSLGQSWQPETDFFTEIDFTRFSPLTYEEGTWDVSYVPAGNAVRPESKVLLKQAGKAVVVERKIDQGKIIWSGLNLFYRPMHHQKTALIEIELQRKIYEELILLEKERLVFTFNRPKPEKVVLTFQGGKGALLKENNYGGWIAYGRAGDEKVKLPVLASGPDFMYAPLPQEIQGQPVTVEFIYRGPLSDWLVFIIALIALFFVLDLSLLNQKIFNFFFFRLKNRIGGIKKQIRERWNEEV